jgi:hypothetical protein
MKNKLLVILFISLFPVCSLAQTVLSSQTPPSRSVIRNVNIVTLDDRGILAGASVVVTGGKIEKILAKGAGIPADATVIDGGGGYLIPGMIDAHVHFGAEHELAGFLRYGVTTVFSLGTREKDIPALLEARKRQASGALVGAHLYATGMTVPSMRELKSVAEVAPFLSGLQSQGFEFVKTYNEIPQDIFDEIVKEGIVTKRFVDSRTCIGAIREGCEADLVLLRADPLENIRNVGSIVGLCLTGGGICVKRWISLLCRPLKENRRHDERRCLSFARQSGLTSPGRAYPRLRSRSTRGYHYAAHTALESDCPVNKALSPPTGGFSSACGSTSTGRGRRG